MLRNACIATGVAILSAASLSAQVVEVDSMLGPSTLVDMDNVGPAGPVTLAQINAGGTPSPANLSGITLTASSAGAGVYDTNTGLGRGLGMDPSGGGGMVLVDPSGSFAPFNATIDFNGPSTEFGFEVGDWNGPMVLDFKLSGTSVGQVTSSGFDGSGEKYFRAACGTVFDSVDITASTTAGNWVITSMVVQLSVPNILADFDATPRVGGAPLTVNFTDLSCAMTSVVAWQWDFDNDGNVDSTAQNPSFTYNNAGSYTVSLTAVDGAGNADTITKPDFIAVAGPTNNTQSADILHLLFNEVRGDKVDNAASTSFGPDEATVSNTGWQADPGRSAFRGNESGFGALGAAGTTNANLVDTGWAPDLADVTIAWWHRAQTAPGSSLAYVFGGSGASVRCFTGGVANQSLWYRGSTIGDVTAQMPVQNVGTWQHCALVIDDANGTATWYFDGVLDTVTNFTPGSHQLQNTDFHVGYHTSTTSTAARYYDLDDFRIYSRPLTQAEVQAAMAQEPAATTTYGPGCPGPNGVPRIGASGGAPQLGNSSFQIEFTNLESGAPANVLLGFEADLSGNLPIDLSVLLGSGCLLENSAALALPLGATGSSASHPLPIPNQTFLIGGHVYAQGLVLGSGFPSSGNGAVTPGLDIGVQN